MGQARHGLPAVNVNVVHPGSSRAEQDIAEGRQGSLPGLSWHGGSVSGRIVLLLCMHTSGDSQVCISSIQLLAPHSLFKTSSSSIKNTPRGCRMHTI